MTSFMPIAKQIDELDEAERDELFSRLREVAGEPEEAIEITPDVQKMLEERNAEYEANPGVGNLTWEEVVAYVKRKR